MSYQDTLLEPEEALVPTAMDAPSGEAGLGACLESIWFQPIVDTFEHRILAYDCVAQYADGSDAIDTAIRSAGAQARQVLYFVNLVLSLTGDPEVESRSTDEAIFDAGLQPE